jgi:hypothetical protein
MPALLLLIAGLIVNYIRHRLHKSTICSTTRPHVGVIPFTLGWGALTGWLWPHYCRPLIQQRRWW